MDMDSFAGRMHSEPLFELVLGLEPPGPPEPEHERLVRLVQLVVCSELQLAVAAAHQAQAFCSKAI